MRNKNRNKGFKILVTGVAEVGFYCEVNLSKFKTQSQVDYAMDNTDLGFNMVEKIMLDGKYQILSSQVVNAKQCECCEKEEQEIDESELLFDNKFMQDSTKFSAIKTGDYFLWDTKNQAFVDAATHVRDTSYPKGTMRTEYL